LISSAILSGFDVTIYFSSKINSNKFLSTFFDKECFVQFDQFKGGGKIISTESLNTLSKREGIIFSRTLDEVYRQGLVLISISHG
jgi:hypothetical protein